MKEDNGYQAKSGQIRQLAALPPDQLVNHLANAHQKLEIVAPGIAPHLHAAAINAVGFLNSKLPNAGNELPQDEFMPPSEAQQKAWLDLHKTVSDPTSVFEHINNHTLTGHHIEALQAVYPDLHQEMIQQIQRNLGEMKLKKQTLPYSKRAAISKFIGQPLDSTMTQPVIESIIMAAGQTQTPQTSQGKPQRRASGAELSQINKVNALDQTQEQARAAHERK